MMDTKKKPLTQNKDAKKALMKRPKSSNSIKMNLKKETNPVSPKKITTETKSLSSDKKKKQKITKKRIAKYSIIALCIIVILGFVIFALSLFATPISESSIGINLNETRCIEGSFLLPTKYYISKTGYFDITHIRI